MHFSSGGDPHSSLLLSELSPDLLLYEGRLAHGQIRPIGEGVVALCGERLAQPYRLRLFAIVSEMLQNVIRHGLNDWVAPVGFSLHRVECRVDGR